MYSAFMEVKLGYSQVTIFTEPEMSAYSDEECLFLPGNRGVLGLMVWMLAQ